MAPIIRVDQLAKSFMISRTGAPREQYTTLREAIGRRTNQAFRKCCDLVRGFPLVSSDTTEEFWALRDVSFEVDYGEVIGIIGRNGAGKSTLLKILSRITEPTKGRVALRGRVASLLEVGTGFHQELTGRENIFLNGAILGMKRREIQRKFDEIVQFAEVEKFLDAPVKRYSSGMYVRLAFAIAAHLETDVLVVDEVLAVGDVNFQRMCMGKMREVGASGRTVLLISHHMPSILNLCSRTVHMDEGRIHAIGDTSQVVSKYLREHSIVSTEFTAEDDAKACMKALPYFQLTRFAIQHPDGTSCATVQAESNAQIDVVIEGYSYENDARFNFAIALMNEEGHCLVFSFSTDQPEREWITLQRNCKNRITTQIDTSILNEGSYRLYLVASLHSVQMLLSTNDNICVGFEVVGNRGLSPYWTTKRDSILAPKLRWTSKRLTTESKASAQLTH